MIQPKPVKYICKTCGYTRIYQAKSDCLDGRDLLATMCPNCHKGMEAKEVGGLDSLIYSIKKIWKK